MLRITADSNIWISALHFGGTPLQLLELAAEGEIDFAVSVHIIEEVARTLRRKFDWPEERVDEARKIMGRIARCVIPSPVIDVIKEDPSDNRILECALEAGSEYIVSGDNHLLRLGQYGTARIVKVAEMLKILRATAGPTAS